MTTLVPPRCMVVDTCTGCRYPHTLVLESWSAPPRHKPKHAFSGTSKATADLSGMCCRVIARKRASTLYNQQGTRAGKQDIYVVQRIRNPAPNTPEPRPFSFHSYPVFEPNNLYISQKRNTAVVASIYFIRCRRDFGQLRR